MPPDSTSITHHVMILVLQLGVILIAARLGGSLLRKLRFPAVIGELLAGMIIGPYLLGGQSFPGFNGGLFPPGGDGTVFPISAELYGIASIAAIVLLFRAGLETNTRLFLRYSLTGSLVGIGGVLVSFVLADLTAVVFLRMVFHTQATFMSPECLLLGVIATPTSVGITVRVLSAKRKVDSPEGVTILSGAVVDDILGIILLAVVLGIIATTHDGAAVNWGRIGRIAAQAAVIWLAATILGLLAARRISLLLKLFHDRSSIAIVSLGLALLLAGVFEEAGLAMIIGAYVMGLSLSRTDINEVVREKLAGVHAFFVPVFFCVMGMLVDFRALASPPVLVFSLAFAGTAIVSKIIGSLPALLVDFNGRGALRIGVGMLPRAEVALIMAGIGIARGVFPEPNRAMGAIVMMVAVTMIVGPQLLVLLLRSPERGSRKPVDVGQSDAVVFEFPSPEAADLLVDKVVASFEAEGFFAHLVHPEESLYQLRKDTTIISFRKEEAKLIFACTEPDKAIVHAALYEVLADFEHMVKALQRPIDMRAVAQKLQEQKPKGAGNSADSFHLWRYLTTDLIEPDLKGSTKNEIIEELLALLDRNRLLGDRESARKAVLDREKTMSTGMQYGIAIPHGRTDTVSRLVCAIGVKRDGVDFDSLDGEPSTIFVITLSPKHATAPHLKFMATISRILDEEGRAGILAATTADEIRSLLLERS